MSHKYGNERIVEWLQKNEYHPRSNKHGSASCEFLLDDLLHESLAFRGAARRGEVVYKEDHTVGEGQLRWNVDLVVGPPDTIHEKQHSSERVISVGEPSEVWLAIDAKSIMTEHGKARRNRQRDINGFADVMHYHYPGAVTGGLLLINMAGQFRSPLRDQDDITEHDNVKRLVEETVQMFRDIDRSNGEISPNVDAVGCIVVEHTNIDNGPETRLLNNPPAPQADDIVEYKQFVRILSDILESRFLLDEAPDFENLRERDALRAQLNGEAIRLASAVHTVGVEIETGDIQDGSVEELAVVLDTMTTLIDEIKNL